MPRVEFKSENKVATTNYDFPKLKLKQGERARILVGLEDPIVEYVHTLRKPQIVNGVPQKVEVINDRTGVKTTEYKMDFVSRPICLGDATILAEKGSDPKNCPACKLAQQHSDYTQPPQRRYAMHVIRYRTKGGTTDLITPFNVECLVWSFTDKTFNKLVDFKEEWGDLRKHDLLLGPCTNETFQQFDITVAAKAAWLESKERQTLTAQTFKENLIPDLTIAAGSVKQKQWVEQDIGAILEAWATINGAEADVDTSDLDADLSNLLDKGEPEEEKWADGKTEAEVTTTPDSEDADELLAGLDEFTPDGASTSDEEEETPEPEAKAAPKRTAAKKAEAKPEPEETSSGPDNFDDLLADLD